MQYDVTAIGLDPLTGDVAIKDGEHFVVTHRNVEGGHR